MSRKVYSRQRGENVRLGPSGCVHSSGSAQPRRKAHGGAALEHVMSSRAAQEPRRARPVFPHERRARTKDNVHGADKGERHLERAEAPAVEERLPVPAEERPPSKHFRARMRGPGTTREGGRLRCARSPMSAALHHLGSPRRPRGRAAAAAPPRRHPRRCGALCPSPPAARSRRPRQAPHSAGQGLAPPGARTLTCRSSRRGAGG